MARIPDCRASCTAQVASGTQVTLVAVANTGSSFAGWSGACAGQGECTIVLDADRSVTATFAPVPPPPAGKHVLTVAKSGSGSVKSSPAGIDCGGACNAIFDDGMTVSLSAAPDSGFRFAGFGGACSGTTCTLTLRSDALVQAVFELESPPPAAGTHTLTVTPSGSGAGTVTSSPAGIDCGSTCSASFADGIQVALTATAASGSRFSGWSGACSGVGDCVVTLDRDVTVAAAFEQMPPDDECAGLAGPADPGAPRTFSSDNSAGGRCLNADADGSGSLAFPLQFGHSELLTFVSSAGARLGSYTGNGRVDFFGKLDGFEGLETPTNGGHVLVFAEDGTVRKRSDDVGTPMSGIVANDPAGGVAVFVAANPYAAVPARLLSFDASGSVRWAVRFSEDRWLRALGVDRAGHTLLLFTAPGVAGQPTAQWIDPAGNGGALFKVALPAGDLALYPRVSGGLFLQRSVRQCGSGACTSAVEWTAEFAALSNTMDAAPDWLQARPQTNLHLARGGRAYAVLPAPSHNADCLPPVELVAPSGKSCGTTSFAEVPDRCRAAGIAVGLDGTVIATSEDAPSCTWRWWPGFYR